MYTGSFLTLGDRCFNLERLFNVREGLIDDSLPDRLTKIPQESDDPKSVVPLDAMLKTYYKVRGWDASGVPKKRTIKNLGIKNASRLQAMQAG
jgi:aldehyde:ferredoxin oxidoreductase